METTTQPTTPATSLTLEQLVAETKAHNESCYCTHYIDYITGDVVEEWCTYCKRATCHCGEHEE